MHRHHLSTSVLATDSLALQATLEVEPADKGLSLVFRIFLVIGPALIERFDSLEASNLLSRKTHLFELSHVCYSWQRLSEFHRHPPVSLSRQVIGCTIATACSSRGSSLSLAIRAGQTTRDLSHHSCFMAVVLDTLLIITSMIFTQKEGRGHVCDRRWNLSAEHFMSNPTTAILGQDEASPQEETSSALVNMNRTAN